MTQQSEAVFEKEGIMCQEPKEECKKKLGAEASYEIASFSAVSVNGNVHMGSHLAVKLLTMKY